jgi:hypothetical protein
MECQTRCKVITITAITIFFAIIVLFCIPAIFGAAQGTLGIIYGLLKWGFIVIIASLYIVIFKCMFCKRKVNTY